MSNAAAESAQKVQIGRQSYTVRATGRAVVNYELTGPRGGKIEGIRNVNTGTIYLMQGAKTLPYRLVDDGGVFSIVAVD